MGLPRFAAYGTYAWRAGGSGARAALLCLPPAVVDSVVAIPATSLLLLFPNRHLPSPRWKWFARVLGRGSGADFLVILVGPGPIRRGRRAPRGGEPARPGIPAPLPGGRLRLDFVIPIGAVGSLVSLVQRFRRSGASSDCNSGGSSRPRPSWPPPTRPAFLFYRGRMDRRIGDEPRVAQRAPNGVRAVVRVYPDRDRRVDPSDHLFDIDVVINRAVLFGALAVFITVVYVAIVAGVGAVVGGQASPLLSAAAAAVVALAFQPARRRAQRFADRLVYGKRATPYEVLSEFSDRLGNTYANEELLPRMARALGEGTGAARADVWMRVGRGDCDPKPCGR